MYGIITLKLIVGMMGVMFFLRLVGKSQMAQITPLDTVGAFVIGALVGDVIYNPDTNIWILLFAIGVWTAITLLVRYSLRFKWSRWIFLGESVYIIKNGVLNVKAMKKNGLELEQLRTMLREIGIFSMYDVENVRFETNGKMTASISDNTIESFLLVNNGALLESSMHNANKTEEWLNKQLAKLGFPDYSHLFCVEWTPKKGFYIVSFDGKITNGADIQIEDASTIEDEVSA